MGRPLRIEYPGALYHITTRGNERKKIYKDSSDKKQFLEILEDYSDRLGILIHCYVLMDNHYHLVMETPGANLLKVMHGINSYYTGYFNRKYKRAGHLFQGRYKGILIDRENYLIELSRYVHLNPVRAKMVKRPEEHEWSSYRGYIRKREAEKWVYYYWILSSFGVGDRKARSRYREYVEGEIRNKISDPLEKLVGQVILGGEEFRGMIRGIIKKQGISEEIVHRDSLLSKYNAGDIIGIVARELGVDEKEIRNRGRGENIARNVGIYMVKKYGGMSNKEVAEEFGSLHYSSIRKVEQRLEEKMKKDKKLKKLVDEICSHIKT